MALFLFEEEGSGLVRKDPAHKCAPALLTLEGVREGKGKLIVARPVDS